MLICYLALLIICSWSKFVFKNVKMWEFLIFISIEVALYFFVTSTYILKWGIVYFRFLVLVFFFILFFFFKLNYRISLFWLFKELFDSLIKDNLKIKCEYSLFYFYCLKKGNSITKKLSSISVNRHIYLW